MGFKYRTAKHKLALKAKHTQKEKKLCSVYDRMRVIFSDE